MTEMQEPAQQMEIATAVLANQSKELDLKQNELVLREKEIQLSHEQSMRSLDLQAQDRREMRNMLLDGHGRQLRWYLWFAALFVLLVLALVYMGQTSLAGDLTKISAGLVTGYWAGKGQAKAKQNKEDE